MNSKLTYQFNKNRIILLFRIWINLYTINASFFVYRKIPRDLTEASLSGAGLSIVAALSMMFLFGMVGIICISLHSRVCICLYIDMLECIFLFGEASDRILTCWNRFGEFVLKFMLDALLTNQYITVLILEKSLLISLFKFSLFNFFSKFISLVIVLIFYIAD